MAFLLSESIDQPITRRENFRFVQIEKKNGDDILKYINFKTKNKCHIGWKTSREMENLLVTSNFSFSHNVFYSYISLVRQNAALCGNGLSFFVKIYITEC